VAGALVALGTRFIDRDLEPYILDEPQLQDAAVAQARSGTWASISVLRGTRGVRYGPVPLWFYGAVHRVAGPRPEAGIIAAGVFLTGAAVALAFALGRKRAGRPWVVAAALWLLAASPFSFFWARLGWDNPLLFGFVALAVALLAGDEPVGVWRALAIGALLGLAMGTHLMAVPVMVSALWVLASERREGSRRLRPILGAAGAAAVVLLPYLVGLRREAAALAAQQVAAQASMHVPIADRLASALTFLITPFRQTAGLGLEAYFDGTFRPFLGWAGLASAFRPLATCVAVLVGLGTVLGLVLGWRMGSPGLRRLARLGVWTWAAQAVFLGALGLAGEPHYHQPVLWIAPVGWGLAVAVAWQRWPGAALGLAGLACLVGLWGLGLQRTWMGWIRIQGGTRGIHYGIPLATQRAALAQACQTPSAAVALATQVVVFPHSLRSLAATEPACQGRRVEVCGPICPALPPDWSLATLRYAGLSGAHLAPVR
jgi:hypothetical protein